jgi:hypothetical protein
MKTLVGAGTILLMLAAPALARHRTHVDVDTGGMNYLHNYGPGPLPGTVATYDGPLRANCKMGAAAYLGQDRRGHPCN